MSNYSKQNTICCQCTLLRIYGVEVVTDVKEFGSKAEFSESVWPFHVLQLSTCSYGIDNFFRHFKNKSAEVEMVLKFYSKPLCYQHSFFFCHAILCGCLFFGWVFCFVMLSCELGVSDFAQPQVCMLLVDTNREIVKIYLENLNGAVRVLWICPFLEQQKRNSIESTTNFSLCSCGIVSRSSDPLDLCWTRTPQYKLRGFCKLGVQKSEVQCIVAQTLPESAFTRSKTPWI